MKLYLNILCNYNCILSLAALFHYAFHTFHYPNLALIMKFNQIKELKDEKFRRLTEVRKGTFSKIVDILRKADGFKKSKGERKNKLNLEEQC
ncbi:IS5 family transposase ISOt6 [Orientia tsutsugamushi]|nr:IS5 family transposase ISOt6 [Orientia tsutsugamushi]